MRDFRTIAAVPVLLASICSCFYLPPGDGFGGGGASGPNEAGVEAADGDVVLFDASIPTNQICVESSDCGACSTCVNGMCTPPPPGACLSNADCPGPMTCMDTCQCQCPSDNCCQTSSDCANNPQGAACLSSGTCGCESSADCTLGSTCVEGACLPCQEDSDCPVNWTCIAGQCDPLPLPCFCPHPAHPVCAAGTSICVQCASDQDCNADAGTGVCDILKGTCGACGNNELVCPPGAVCNDDVCVTVGETCPDGGESINDVGPGCTAECPAGGVCDSAGDCCLGTGSIEGSCMTDDDCAGFPGARACSQGTCVTCTATDPGSCQAGQSCWSPFDICVLGLDGGVAGDGG